MKVFRDVYYVAVKSPYESPYERLMDYAPYDLSLQGGVAETIRSVLDRPRQTRENNPAMFDTLFASRRSVDFELDKDHFFTLGDNSPQSQDARIWNDYEHYVDRQYMIGKALFIYWPQATGPIYLPNPWDGFRFTLRIVPNIPRMGFVR
jgi:signal peptidase I